MTPSDIKLEAECISEISKTDTELATFLAMRVFDKLLDMIAKNV